MRWLTDRFGGGSRSAARGPSGTKSGGKGGRSRRSTKGSAATKGSGATRGSGGTRRSSSSRRKRTTQRRTPLTLAVVWTRLRAAAVALLAVAVVAGAAWVWKSGVIGREWAALGDAVDHVAMHGGLVVRSVTVEGRERTPPTRLLAALGTGRGEPILRFDPQDARARVEALPWVASARVERRLPDAIHVVLVEREPLALWQRGSEGDFAVIDTTGLPLDVDTRPYADLPVIVGADAPARVPALVKMLKTEPDLASRVRAATWIGGRRWTLRLDDIKGGIDVALPEEGAADAWANLARLERQGRLLARDIDRVDMRFPDRLVVRLTPSGKTAPDASDAPAVGTRAAPRAVTVSTDGQET